MKRVYYFEELSEVAQNFARECAASYLWHSGIEPTKDEVESAVNKAVYTANGYYIGTKTGEELPV